MQKLSGKQSDTFNAILRYRGFSEKYRHFGIAIQKCPAMCFPSFNSAIYLISMHLLLSNPTAPLTSLTSLFTELMNTSVPRRDYNGSMFSNELNS